ncbi:protein hairless-like [Macrosteles quadrilineatus]|uniref:protein hairless-like n=1 Tax=Macrosteles quadrilineatus TaxID=74068 RepID=UPI0023E146C4|nr:protein hairless-like [Macrosteles quadrilineatus]
MRVQELGPTPCVKMSEERNRPVNGDVSTGGIKKELQDTNGPPSPCLNTNCDSDNVSSISGGRLKFFKDGKFILELSHRKEGERTCWIPVPKKTFWPAVGTPKQECSTSLSVSDDNSSVQSSPWQRDHCWKQTAPVHNAGRGMEFVMLRRKGHRLKYTPKSVRRKRRRPYDTSTVDWNERLLPTATVKRENTKINSVTQMLWERVVRADPGIVSPRKRILRELEKVTLEDQNNSKRQRARPSPEQPKPSAVGSHSITSILAREDEPSFLRSLLRSSPPPPPPVHAPTIHPLYPYSSPSPSYVSPTSNFYSPLPSYRGSPSVWGMHHYPLRNSYPVPSFTPVTTPPWNVPYQPIDIKREDCTSDTPLNLSKDAG